MRRHSSQAWRSRETLVFDLSSTIRESGRSAQGVRLLHMEAGDRVAAAVVIPADEEPNGALIQ